MSSYDWLFEDSDTIAEKDVQEEKSESTSFSVNNPKVQGTFGSHEPIWTTAKGDKIPLSKMETRHIRNCIRLLESKNMFKHKWYRIFQDELERRRAGKLETSFSL